MRTVVWGSMIVVALILSVSIAAPRASAAGPAIVAVEGAGYNVESALEDNLKALTGKSVTVTLASGKQMSGKVKSVGMHLLHLEKLDGKEFFDALIRLERIEAIDTRFREYQR